MSVPLPARVVGRRPEHGTIAQAGVVSIVGGTRVLAGLFRLLKSADFLVGGLSEEPGGRFR
jgi:hypothetical protein